MRLFTGISIGAEVVAKLAQTLEQLRPTAALKWSPVENLHITSKFIGQWPDDRLNEMESTLAAMEPVAAMDIEVARFGFYPNPHRPRVFFAGVHAGAGLAELARRIEDALAPLGCPKEERTYSPHLTLARIKDENIQSLREHIASMNDFDFGRFHASDFHLYLSKPGRAGSIYSILATYPLKETSTQI